MNLAKLLEHKRALLEGRRQSSSDRLAAIDNALHEIDEHLTRLESADVPPRQCPRAYSRSSVVTSARKRVLRPLT